MHISFNTTSIFQITSIHIYIDYYIANRWEVAEAVLVNKCEGANVNLFLFI